MLVGHAIAHEQMDLIDRCDAFHIQFSHWLFENHRISASTGWGEAIESLSEDRPTTVQRFEQWVSAFMEQWEDSPNAPESFPPEDMTSNDRVKPGEE